MNRYALYLVISLFFIFISAPTVYSQAPDTLWTKTLGEGTAYAVFQTTDGGFVVGGYTTVSGWRDFYIAKTDGQGEIIWEKTFGDEDRNESLTAMIKTSDGGYLLVGNRAEDPPYNNYSDLYLVKTDASGILEWYSIIGEGGESETPNSVAETSEGGFILCGSFWYDGYNAYDVVLTKVSDLGAFEWKQYYNFDEGKSDRGLWVETAPDGGFLVTGETQAFNSNYDYDAFIMKTTPSGTLEVMNTFGEDWPMYEGSHRLVQCTDGGYLICGYQNNDGIDNNWYVVKTGGDISWEHTIGGTYQDKAFNACETAEGGFAVTGTYYLNDNWNFFVVKYNYNGDTLWTKMWGDSDHSQYNYDIKQLDDGGYVTVGSSAITGQIPHIYLTRLLPGLTGIDQPIDHASPHIELLGAQPNPFHHSTKIGYRVNSKNEVIIKLYDLSGNMISIILNETQESGTHKVSIVEDFPAGIYFCKIESGGMILVEKLVKTK